MKNPRKSLLRCQQCTASVKVRFSVIYTLLKVHNPFQYQLPGLLHSGGYYHHDQQNLKGKMKHCRERAPHERRYSDITGCIFFRRSHYDAAAVALLGGVRVLALVDLRLG